MKTKSLTRLALLALALLALASASAQAGGRRCWHPFLGGFYVAPPIVIPIGPLLPPPPAARQPIPVGAVDGPYLRSPWSSAVIPLSSIRYPGQIVYDAQTGLPFRAP